MRRLILTIILLPLFLLSCQDNNGYPNKIEFPVGGGEITVSGNYSFYSISIIDNSGNEVISTSEDNIITSKYDWLTVIHNEKTNALTFIATPSTQNKKRSLTVTGNFVGNEYAEITVYQYGHK